MGAPPRTWTAQEDNLLRDMYLSHSRAAIAASLSRTTGSIRKRCSTLGLNTKNRPWSKAETDALVTFYVEHIDKPFPAGGLRAFADKLGRDHASVCGKAGELGFTDASRHKCDGTAAANGARATEWHRTHAHPRGALGMRHSAETKAKIAAKSLASWRDPGSVLNSEEERCRRSDDTVRRIREGTFGNAGYTRCVGGQRPDLGGAYFRSRWEANYARYLNLLLAQKKIAGWYYEPTVFEFKAIRRGTRSYTPDFKVVISDVKHEWHEVKGWMDQKSRTRLSRMAKYYPDEVIRVIDKTWFRSAIRSIAPLIPAWEYGQAKRRGSSL